jgi:octaprenyl-diphosphate synthase
MDALALPIQHDLEALEACLERMTESRFRQVPEVSRYLIHAGGKRIRPVACFLACRLFDPPHPGRIHVAAAIELLHTATLLHDDIVDQATLRRGRPSANARFGNQLTVLVGDYLLSRATLTLIGLKNFPTLEVFAQTAKAMAEGEVLQLGYQGLSNLSPKGYMTLIFRKTALLMGTSTGAAALVHTSDPKAFKALKAYGVYVGYSFQIMDDVLDYVAMSDGFGNERFKDIKEGKVTVRLLFALKKAKASERRFLEGLLAERAVPNGAEQDLLDVLERTKSISGAKRTAEAFIEKAAGALLPFEGHPEIPSLKALGRFVIERTR